MPPAGPAPIIKKSVLITAVPVLFRSAVSGFTTNWELFEVAMIRRRTTWLRPIAASIGLHVEHRESSTH